MERCSSATNPRPFGRLHRTPPAVAASLMLACSLFATGCASTEGMMHESFRIFKPRVSDYRDETQEVDEEWDSVGKAARSNRPLENENDPLKEWFMSPKAKSIERSLGYE